MPRSRPRCTCARWHERWAWKSKCAILARACPKTSSSRMAEPFFRPDTARTRSAGGVGLGLYLCKLVAHAHGGDLFDSQCAAGPVGGGETARKLMRVMAGEAQSAMLRRMNTIPLPGFVAAPTRFLFFTGKGGVGKTSLSTATAIALADAGKRVLAGQHRRGLQPRRNAGRAAVQPAGGRARCARPADAQHRSRHRRRGLPAARARAARSRRQR